MTFMAYFNQLAYGSKEAITSQEDGQSSATIDDVNDGVEERFRALEVHAMSHINKLH